MGTLRVLDTADLPGVQGLTFDGASQIYSHYNDVFSIATLFRCESSISFRGKAHQGLDGAVGLLEPDGIFRHLHIPIAESGLPPHQYQTHVRLARARALLRRGEPASQVAIAVGFADQSHFVRAFRRFHGLTPGAYFARAKPAAGT